MTLLWPQFITSTKNEATKLALLRLTLALVLIYRSVLNSFFIGHFPDQPDSLLRPEYYLAIGLCLAVGFGTRLSYLVLLLTYVKYNIDFSIMNLGPLLMIPLFIAGLLLDNAPKFSVDQWLQKKNPLIYKRTYLWNDKPANVGFFNLIYGFVFLTYAINSLAAVGHHIQDQYWMSGQTVQAMLVNNYLSRYFTQFRDFESTFPSLLYTLSVLSIALQTLFQMLMIPLLFNKWGRWFVVLHGFGFFLFSLFFLQISLLPYIEIIMWMLIFWQWLQAGLKAPPTYRISLSRAQTIFLAAFIFLSIGETATIHSSNKITQAWNRQVSPYLKYIGIWPPNVFNKTDLKMGESWFTIHRLVDKESTLVPVFSASGGRLDYHINDYFYYANTLKWRRSAIDSDWSNNKESQALKKSIERICLFDFSFHGLKSITSYEIQIFRDNSMDLSLTAEERYSRSKIDQYTFEVHP